MPLVAAALGVAPVNVVVLVGTLSRPPEERTLPSGDRLVAFEVTTRPPEGRAESVPVVWPGATPAAVALPAGEAVVVVGRVRRRFFRSGGATASRTEVVASGIVALRHTRRARRLVERALAEIGTAPSSGAAPAVAPEPVR